jgi:hypothetical protein
MFEKHPRGRPTIHLPKSIVIRWSGTPDKHRMFGYARATSRDRNRLGQLALTHPIVSPHRRSRPVREGNHIVGWHLVNPVLTKIFSKPSRVPNPLFTGLTSARKHLERAELNRTPARPLPRRSFVNANPKECVANATCDSGRLLPQFKAPRPAFASGRINQRGGIIAAARPRVNCHSIFSHAPVSNGPAERRQADRTWHGPRRSWRAMPGREWCSRVAAASGQ